MTTIDLNNNTSLTISKSDKENELIFEVKENNKLFAFNIGIKSLKFIISRFT